MYVNVFFVVRCLYSTVSLTLVRKQPFIRIIYYYYWSHSGVHWRWYDEHYLAILFLTKQWPIL